MYMRAVSGVFSRIADFAARELPIETGVHNALWLTETGHHQVNVV
jgi:hypothetical protein